MTAISKLIEYLDALKKAFKKNELLTVVDFMDEALTHAKQVEFEQKEALAQMKTVSARKGTYAEVAEAGKALTTTPHDNWEEELRRFDWDFECPSKDGGMIFGQKRVERITVLLSKAIAQAREEGYLEGLENRLDILPTVNSALDKAREEERNIALQAINNVAQTNLDFNPFTIEKEILRLAQNNKLNPPQ